MPVLLQYSDLQLLHKLFCNNSDPFTIYDPQQRLQNYLLAEKDPNESVFNLSLNGSCQYKSMKFYFGKSSWTSGRKYIYINNPDGTMRWLIPAQNKSASHLQLFNSETFRARLYKSASRFLFKAGRGNWLSTSSFYVEQNLENAVKRCYGISDTEEYAIFTGTRGNNRKVVLAVSREETVTHFIKVPVSEKSKQLVENEVNMLKELSKYDFTSLSIPRVTDTRVNAYARLSNIKPAVTIPAQRISDLHIRALTELYSFNHEKKAIADSAAWQTITKNMEWMQQAHNYTNGLDEIKAKRIIHLLRKLFNSMNAGEAIPVSVSHGDFTPWNMYCDVHRLYVYDWELSSNGIPMLFDLYHFIFQSQVLVHHQPYSKIKQNIDSTFTKYNVQRLVNKYRINKDLHFKLYLLFTVSYYMRLYIEEQQLLLQAHWMVDSWLDALEDVNSKG